ncbi:MAG: sensor histidine kinase [Flavobacteriales bacterium]|nr:sensor histidine kinase [Flavobacteriales bacterium]
MSLINLATIYRENGDFNKCYKTLLESEKIAKKIGATTQLRDCYQRLYESYEMENNTKQAYKYYKLYIAAKDSMMSDESLKNIERLQAQYENEAKQLTIQNLTKKEELNKVQLERNKAELRSKNITNISLIGGLVLSIILVLFFSYSVKQRTKNNLVLKKSLDEKEVLFKEVHHRVKNNFQVISSLLNLHANNTDNEAVQKALGEAKDRVGSMALVHEKLYQSKDLTQIKMDEYISQLIEHLIASFDSQIDFESIIKIDNVYMDIETAVPLGLIFNELITNSIKYAFKQKANNAIEIEIKKVGDKIQVKYKDNGIGLPKDFDLDNLESLGLNLVQILVLQIHGELVVKIDNGTCFSFEFNLPK